MHKIKNTYTITISNEQSVLLFEVLLAYKYYIRTIVNNDEYVYQTKLLDDIALQLPDEFFFANNNIGEL